MAGNIVHNQTCVTFLNRTLTSFIIFCKEDTDKKDDMETKSFNVNSGWNEFDQPVELSLGLIRNGKLNELKDELSKLDVVKNEFDTLVLLSNELSLNRY